MTHFYGVECDNPKCNMVHRFVNWRTLVKGEPQLVPEGWWLLEARSPEHGSEGSYFTFHSSECLYEWILHEKFPVPPSDRKIRDTV